MNLSKLFLLVSLIPFSIFAQIETSDTDVILNYGYIPIDPISYNYPIGFYPNSSEFYLAMDNGATPAELMQIDAREELCFKKRGNRSIFFSDIPTEKITQLLPNETVSVAVKSIKKSGEAKYLGSAAISGKNETYEVTADYIKFATINLFEINEDGTPGDIISYVRVGVGLRLKASITTKKKGINIGNLFGLAIAASKEELFGSLTVSVIGMESKDITTTLPLPSEISLSSIATALQAMATIKSKLHDNGTVKIPQVISIRSVDETLTESQLIYDTSSVLNRNGNTSPLLANPAYIESFLPNLFDQDCLTTHPR